MSLAESVRELTPYEVAGVEGEDLHEDLCGLFEEVPKLPIFSVPRLSIEKRTGILPAWSDADAAVHGLNAIAAHLSIASLQQIKSCEMLSSVCEEPFETVYDLLKEITASEAMRAEDIVRSYPIWRVDTVCAMEFVDEHLALAPVVSDAYGMFINDSLREGLSCVNGALIALQMLTVASTIHERNYAA